MKNSLIINARYHDIRGITHRLETQEHSNNIDGIIKYLYADYGKYTVCRLKDNANFIKIT